MDTSMRRLVRSAGCLAGLALVVCASACSTSVPEDWNDPMKTKGPLRAGDDLVYLNQTLEQVHRVEPTRSDGEPTLETSRAPTGDEPTTMELSPSGERLFVVNAEDRTLDVFDLTGSNLSKETVQLDSPYDRITVSPDGKFALLSFSEEPGDTCVVCNVSEVGIVDLRDGVPESATFLSLTKRAFDLEFAAPFEVDGTTQRLVAALSPSQVTLIDLRAALNGDSVNALREIPLTLSEAQSVRRPEAVMFDLDPGDSSRAAAHLYVRVANSRDVTKLLLRPSSSSSKTFEISRNQLAAGSGPSAMTLLELDDGDKRLMTLDRQRAAFSLIDVQSGESRTFDLPTGTPATDMLRYEIGGSSNQSNGPNDSSASNGSNNSNGSGASNQSNGSNSSGASSETRILAYSTNSEIVAVVRPETIAVSGNNPTLGQSVEAIRLDGAPTSVRLQSSGDRIRAIAALEGGNSAVLKLRSDDNIATLIQSPPLAGLFFGQNAAWGVFTAESNMARYELGSGHGTPFELPEPGRRVFVDGDASLVTVEHGSPVGTFSVIDTDELSSDNIRQKTRLFEGVFLNRLLQMNGAESSP